MNFGGRDIRNGTQSVKGKEGRGPLNNISERKNKMEFEQNNMSEYNCKQMIGSNSLGQSNEYSNANSNNNIMKQINFGQLTQLQSNKLNPNVQADTKQREESLYQLETLRFALRDAIDENQILRNRVTEMEALYAAAEDEIEKRDSCIQELLVQIEKMSESESVSHKQIKNHRRNYSQ